MHGTLATAPVRRIPRLALAAIFATAVAVTALDNAFIVDDAARQMRHDGHSSILSHTASAPDRYRVLVPYVVEGAIRVMSLAAPYDTAFDTAYAVFYMAGFAWMLWTLFSYLSIWFTEEQALVGALAAASTLRLTMQEYTPFSVLEPSFLALALILSYRQRRWWLAVLVAVASLNRETAVFLPLLFALTSPMTRRNIVTTAGLFAIWAVVVAGVRYVGGDADRVWDLASIWNWNSNTSHLILAAQNVVLLLGAFWIFAALGYKWSPRFVRRTALVIPPYLATLAIWGVWSEVRLLTSLYPIVFSLALSYLFRPDAGNAVQRQPHDGARLPFARPLVIAAILASVAGLNAYHYSFLVPRAALRAETHRAVLDHSAEAPERFHLLVPYAVEAVARPAAAVMPHEKAVSRTYAAYYLIGLTALLYAHFIYFNLWCSREMSVAGALIVADTIRIALRQGEYIGQAALPDAAVFAPHSILEPTLIAAALILIVRHRSTLLACLTAIAALNSEAALLIPLLCLAVNPETNRAMAAACAGVAAIVLIAIRLWVGGAWLSGTLAAIWQTNMAHLPTVALNITLLLGAVWVLGVMGYARSTAFLRRAAVAGVPAVALAVGVFGYWWDVRLLMPLYAMVVPLALVYLSGAGDTNTLDTHLSRQA